MRGNQPRSALGSAGRSWRRIGLGLVLAVLSALVAASHPLGQLASASPPPLAGQTACPLPGPGVTPPCFASPPAGRNAPPRSSLSRAGTVLAWGGVPDGQLGNGSTTGSLTPVQLCAAGQTAPCSSFLGGVNAIAAGVSHSVALLLPNSPGSVSLQPTSAFVDTDGQISLMLQVVTPTDGLSRWSFDVAFDPFVAFLAGCSFTSGSQCTPVNSYHVQVSGSLSPALKGTQVLATLVFQGYGTPGTSGTVRPSVQTFIDGTGAARAPSVSGSTLVIGPKGDVNNDGRVNAVDALCVLRTVAALAATESCPTISLTPDSPGNVNRDQRVDALDALCILRGVAGLPETAACPVHLVVSVAAALSAPRVTAPASPRPTSR